MWGLESKGGITAGVAPLFLCPMGDLPYSRLATHLPVYYVSSEFSSHNNQLSFTLQTASCELRTRKKQMWVRNDTELQGK